MRSALSIALIGVAAAVFSTPAAASFHFMQIEQVMGGECGNAQFQVIQLRMRAGGQNQVSGTRLIASDANGANPVTILILPSNVSVATAGSHILIASPAAAAILSGEDFTMTAPIPAAYLAAGRLVFTDPSGATIYWSVSWGGAGYTGSNAGALTNDPDGNFGPPFATALLAGTAQALVFQGAASAMSTNNAADYAYSTGAASFTNNAGTAVQSTQSCVYGNGLDIGS